jgi:hypothetical protein
MGGVQSKLVALRSKSAYHAYGLVCEIRMVSEGFTRMYIGQMQFNVGYGDACQRITQCNAGVSEGSRIDQNEAYPLLTGLMNAVNQNPFMIALGTIETVPKLCGCSA